MIESRDREMGAGRSRMRREVHFVARETMRCEQLADPDYRLKRFTQDGASIGVFACSKCHHCR